MNILIICAGDRSNYKIGLNSIKTVIQSKPKNLTVCVLDNNREIIHFLKKRKIKYVSKKIQPFFKKIKKNEYDWLLNIWGFKILKKNFLYKFKNNLNIHPSYLPFNRGRDPYYFSVLQRSVIGATIHKMDHTIDGGKYFVRKKIKLNFPYTAGEVFDKSLKLSREIFIKNWKSIQKNKLKLKKFPEKINIVNKRATLIKNNFIDLDKKDKKYEKSFVLNCLAQDFDFLKIQIKLFKKIYNCKIILEKSLKKKW